MTGNLIEQQMAIALVRGGLSLDDFCNLTPSEWGAVVHQINEVEQTRHRESWEQTRIIAYNTIRPHLPKGTKLSDIFPLPWDAERPTPPRERIPTDEEVRTMIQLFGED